MEPQTATSRIQPGQLVSLWYMNEFFVSELYSFMETLREMEFKLGRNLSAEASEQDRMRILSTTEIIWKHCRNAGLGGMSDPLQFLSGQLMRRVADSAFEGYGQSGAIRQDIKTFRESLINALEPKRFLYMPEPDAAYYEQDDLFGVKDKFPEANKELTAAGNCYAVGLYTACVFHLMRVVEIGARKMMSDLKARKHLPNPRRPIELCEWGDLTGAIDEGVKLLRVGSRTSMAKKNKFEFYSHAAAQFRNFKDAWRNNVSHSRREYRQGGAKDVMDNTRQFMQHLASRTDTQNDF